MKKTLLAAALLAGYAGAASAQSSVTLYGVVDIGLNYQMIKPGKAAANVNSADKTNSQFGLASGQQSGSRWGLKGVEDLGNGLKANFVYESAVNATNGSGNDNFARQSTLGLTSSSWGAVDLGRRTAPSTQAFSGIDPFSAGYGTAATTATIGTNFYRLSNMVMYSTPSMSGFSANVGYSFDTGLSTGGTTPRATPSFGNGYKTKAVSVGLRYANGPILAAATYDTFNSNGYRGPEASATAKPGNVNIWAVGATYNLKVVKLHAAYSQATGGVLNNQSTIRSVETGGDTNSGGALQFISGARTSSWMAGLSAPVGAAGSVFGSVQQKIVGGSLKDLETANELIASIGYTYSMSKRTNVYAYYSYVDNAAMIKDASVNTIGLGLRHLF
jgi:predicted porin